MDLYLNRFNLNKRTAETHNTDTNIKNYQDASKELKEYVETLQNIVDAGDTIIDSGREISGFQKQQYDEAKQALDDYNKYLIESSGKIYKFNEKSISEQRSALGNWLAQSGQVTYEQAREYVKNIKDEDLSIYAELKLEKNFSLEDVTKAYDEAQKEIDKKNGMFLIKLLKIFKMI